MPYSILLVDDDPVVMKVLKKTLPKQCKCTAATSYENALSQLRKVKNCRVLIAELGVGGKDGLKFLSHVQAKYPRIVCMILTASRNFDDARAALNAGVFRFLEKSCSAEDLRKAVGRALRRGQEERDQRNTLMGSVKALVDILDLVNPEAMGFAKRIRDRVVATGKALGFRPLWQLELAVMLSHIGCVALPSEIVQKVDRVDPLTPEEKQIFSMHPDIASNLLANIPQMAPIAGIISHQHDTFKPEQPLGSRIIKVALDLDRFERTGRDPLIILDKMGTKSELYDPNVVNSMLKLLSKSSAASVKMVSVEDLKEGMVMAQDLVNKDGTKLLLRGQVLSRASLIRLQSFHVALGILDAIHVVEEKKGVVE